MAKKPKRANLRPARKCIFCGGTPLSKEHIFPAWLHPYLPKSNDLNHETQAHLVFKTHTETKVRKRAGEPHSGRLKVVCIDCNTGWMSRLQSATKPFLLPLVKGSSAVLWMKQQKLLAAWVAMFTMVTEFYEGDPMYVAVPSSEREYLKEHLLPPPNWRIWIGYYERGRWIGLWFHTAAAVTGNKEHVPEKSPSGAPFPNTQATSFVAGRLYVHVFSSIIPALVNKQEVGPGMPRVWPITTTPVMWPPSLALTDRGAEGIATAFARRGAGDRFPG